MGEYFLNPSRIGELTSVISSDLFELDEYIKSYLNDPTLPLTLKIKIGLRHYVTPELIIQLTDFKDYLKSTNFYMFQDIF